MRSKPKRRFLVKDLAQANQTLAEIAVLKREAQAAARQARIEALESGLAAFAEFGKAELFKDRRTCELDFGRLGFRRSSEVRPKPRNTWAAVLGRVKELGLVEAVRVREDVNREALRQWPEARLELVGARRVEKDVFWCEVNEEALGQGAEGS